MYWGVPFLQLMYICNEWNLCMFTSVLKTFNGCYWLYFQAFRSIFAWKFSYTTQLWGIDVIYIRSQLRFPIFQPYSVINYFTYFILRFFILMCFSSPQQKRHLCVCVCVLADVGVKKVALMSYCSCVFTWMRPEVHKAQLEDRACTHTHAEILRTSTNVSAEDSVNLPEHILWLPCYWLNMWCLPDL